MPQDGSFETSFAARQLNGRLRASDLVPDLELSSTAIQRVDGACWALQREGYSAEQIALIIRSLCSRDLRPQRECFHLYGGLDGGGLDRAELGRAVAPIREALPWHEREGFDGKVADMSSVRDAIGFNEFASFLKVPARVGRRNP